ncbi:DUF6591 domain-containing protein [Dysgonomonas sp. 25]|uniref:DUF6591 domain-containing protein n=1 Tax=Dysgonomonas sp. 25 TaxID=2302933 RepID=UPI0013D56C03|nr:DUF6591 domain-containing protein [Dysgonomonas sp. 25]NDV68810.1 hypothetical protein [Dysgonomonas sp. 25]
MKLKTLFAIAIIAILAFSSCSGNKKDKVEEQPKELTPYDTTVKGYLSKVFQVKEGSYKLEIPKETFRKVFIQVKIVSIEKGDTDDYSFESQHRGPLYLSVCNKDGQPIANYSNIPCEYQMGTLLKGMAENVGEENWILFEEYNDYEMPKDAATFIITSKKIERPRGTSSSSNTESDNDFEKEEKSSSTSNSKDWDKILDDYEAYIDKSIKLYKKLEDNDMSAVAEYADLMGKAEDLQKSLDEADRNDDLSAKQLGRMLKIQTKMMEAAKDMK